MRDGSIEGARVRERASEKREPECEGRTNGGREAGEKAKGGKERRKRKGGEGEKGWKVRDGRGRRGGIGGRGGGGVGRVMGQEEWLSM